jgi:hypothetical protein
MNIRAVLDQQPCAGEPPLSCCQVKGGVSAAVGDFQVSTVFQQEQYDV